MQATEVHCMMACQKQNKPNDSDEMLVCNKCVDVHHKTMKGSTISQGHAACAFWDCRKVQRSMAAAYSSTTVCKICVVVLHSDNMGMPYGQFKNVVNDKGQGNAWNTTQCIVTKACYQSRYELYNHMQ